MPLTSMDYATSVREDEAIGRWLRRTVGAAAISYGGLGCASLAWHVAISRKWFDAPIDFGSFNSVQDTLAMAWAAALGLTGIAGVMLLRRRTSAIGLLRIGLTLAIALPNAERVHDALRGEGWFWVSLNAGWTLAHSVLAAVLLTLTFGPPGRAIRQTLVGLPAA